MANVNINKDLILDMVYPVGSIYISVVSTNPGNLFGGTWERFARGRTLVGYTSGETYANAVLKEGGAKNHYHMLPLFTLQKSSSDFGIGVLATDTFHQTTPTSPAQASPNWYIKNPSGTGVSSGGKQWGTTDADNFQPYIVTYMWRRIA